VSWFALVIGLVAAERLAELVHAARNTRALRARGAVELGARHYPLIVALHASWLVAILVFAPRDAPLVWPWIAIFLVLQVARIWVLLTLGRYWTTRIISLPDAPLVTRGPYRFLRHPNYVVVTAEIAVLPLAFHEPLVALIFTALNLALLAWRVRVENQALAVRQG
jgi:methyltransferase